MLTDGSSHRLLQSAHGVKPAPHLPKPTYTNIQTYKQKPRHAKAKVSAARTPPLVLSPCTQEVIDALATHGGGGGFTIYQVGGTNLLSL